MKTIALCKWRGALIIAEFSRCKEGTTGHCPECGAAEFHNHAGWVECDCGFAITKTDYDRIIQEPPPAQNTILQVLDFSKSVARGAAR
jgi:hypothetical protein